MTRRRTRLSRPPRRLPVLAALTLAATVGGVGEASGIGVPRLTPPPVDLPRLPPAPALPVPAAPTLPEPQASPPVTKSPGPTLATPILPPAATREAAPAPGAHAPSVTSDPRGGRSVSSAAPSGGSGTASALQPRSRPARELRLQRRVRRLAGCLDALPGLERRVLVLRAGLGGYRPHSRRGAAKRLGASVRRVRQAERRGLRRLARANLRSGCAGAGGQDGAGADSDGGSLGITDLSAAPMLAELLGAGPSPGADVRASGRGTKQPAGAGRPDSDVAGALATPNTAAADAGADAFPFIALLALLAAGLAAVLLRPGLRLAGGALEERSERATDRRQQQLVADVNGILDERE